MTEEVKTQEQEEQEYQDLFAEMSKGVLDEDEEGTEDDGTEAGKPAESAESTKATEDEDAGVSKDDGASEKKSEGYSGSKNWRDELGEDAKRYLDTIERDQRITRHKLKSDEGRVSALQKKINRLEAAIKEAEESKAAGADEDIEIEIPSDVMEFAEEFPQIRKFVEAVTKSGMKAVKKDTAPSKDEGKRTEVESASQTGDELSEEQKQAQAELEEALLVEVPNFPTIIKHPEFGEWLNGQPGYIQNLVSSADLGDLVALFKDHWDPYVLKKYPPKQAGNNEGSANTAEDSTTSKADEVSNRRKDAMDDVAVGSRQTREIIENAAEGDDNYDALFKKESARANKKRLGII